jgi:hypothetical protein
MNPPSEDISTMLDGVSALALDLGTNLFISEMPPTPDLCVGIYDTGGDEAELNYVYERPSVQVRVRGDKGAYREGHELAQSIKNELHGTANSTIGTSRYVLIVGQGDILFVGYDDNHRPEFTVNFSIHRTDAAS